VCCCRKGKFSSGVAARIATTARACKWISKQIPSRPHLIRDVATKGKNPRLKLLECVEKATVPQLLSFRGFLRKNGHRNKNQGIKLCLKNSPQVKKAEVSMRLDYIELVRSEAVPKAVPK
jgi:hypothetical protein